MKKLLIAVMMGVAFTGNANAFEFKVNNDVIVQSVIAQIINKTLGNTVTLGDEKVVVHTTGMVTTGKATKCWNSPFYDSDGNMHMRIQCH